MKGCGDDPTLMPPLSRYALNIFLKCVSEHLVNDFEAGRVLGIEMPFAHQMQSRIDVFRRNHLRISLSPDLLRSFPAGTLQAGASNPALKSTMNLKFNFNFGSS